MTKYKSRLEHEYEISTMSTSFIKNQIEYIEHTEVNKIYLELLEKELKKRNKNIITFKLLKP